MTRPFVESSRTPQDEQSGWVWMTAAQASAVWVASHRLKASAERNQAESGDDEGDKDWSTLLSEILVAWHDRTFTASSRSRARDEETKP